MTVRPLSRVEPAESHLEEALVELRLGERDGRLHVGAGDALAVSLAPCPSSELLQEVGVAFGMRDGKREGAVIPADPLRARRVGECDARGLLRQLAEWSAEEHPLGVRLRLSGERGDEGQAGCDEAYGQHLLLGAMQGDDERLVVSGSEVVQLVQHQGEPDTGFGDRLADGDDHIAQVVGEVAGVGVSGERPTCLAPSTSTTRL